MPGYRPPPAMHRAAHGTQHHAKALEPRGDAPGESTRRESQRGQRGTAARDGRGRGGVGGSAGEHAQGEGRHGGSTTHGHQRYLCSSGSACAIRAPLPGRAVAPAALSVLRTPTLRLLLLGDGLRFVHPPPKAPRRSSVAWRVSTQRCGGGGRRAVARRRGGGRRRVAARNCVRPGTGRREWCPLGRTRPLSAARTIPRGTRCGLDAAPSARRRRRRHRAAVHGSARQHMVRDGQEFRRRGRCGGSRRRVRQACGRIWRQRGRCARWPPSADGAGRAGQAPERTLTRHAAAEGCLQWNRRVGDADRACLR